MSPDSSINAISWTSEVFSCHFSVILLEHTSNYYVPPPKMVQYLRQLLFWQGRIDTMCPLAAMSVCLALQIVIGHEGSKTLKSKHVWPKTYIVHYLPV